MTINAQVYKFLHTGGTKFYEIWAVEDTSVTPPSYKMISRWGKVGLSGFFKETLLINGRTLESAVAKKITKRKSRGYELKDVENHVGNSLADIMPGDVYRRYARHVESSLCEVDEPVVSEDTVREVVRPEPPKPRVIHKNWGDW